MCITLKCLYQEYTTHVNANCGSVLQNAVYRICRLHFEMFSNKHHADKNELRNYIAKEKFVFH